MSERKRLTALVVHESMFGNTATIAEAVARGLELEDVDVSTTDVANAPELADVHADLLVIGGPTHAFSMSRPSTREDAVRQGAPAARAEVGLREWLRRATPRPEGLTQLAAVFDTRARKVRLLPKSAGTRSGHVLRQLGFTLLERPVGFVVEDIKGPLLEGEPERAVAWGRELAHACEDHLAATDLERGHDRRA